MQTDHQQPHSPSPTVSPSLALSFRRRVFRQRRPLPRRLNIRSKVFLLLLVQSLLVVFAFSLLVGWSFDKGFAEYMNSFNDQRAQIFADNLQAEYAKSGNWQALQSNHGRWAELAMVAAGHKPGDIAELEALFEQFKGNEFPESIPAPLPLRFVLLDEQKRLLIGTASLDVGMRQWPIHSGNAVVGILGLALNKATPYDQQFRQRFLTARGLILGGSVLLAMLPAFFIARLVTRPVQQIGLAARLLADGQQVETLPLESNDELSDLAADFNQLASALKRNQDLQRQWLAEISHELRTPVAILLAEAEAVIDGLRAPTTEGFRSLQEEAKRLWRLIDDLHQLSLLDGGIASLHPADLDVGVLLASCIELSKTRFTQRNLTLQYSVRDSDNLKTIGDADRLRQVFMNLLENSLRYTDAGGCVRIQACREIEHIAITFEDSSPSVATFELSQLFKRLYRGESSRNRASGGSGLGLAIVHSIVAAHSGSISASQSPLGGLRFDIKLVPVVTS
jgi:two-component system sensor histidine kinase BaeS